MRLNRRSPHASGAGKLQTRKNEITPLRVRSIADFERANSRQDESALADLRRNWSTILKASPAPAKAAAFHNQPSRFTAWRLFVSRLNAHQS